MAKHETFGQTLRKLRQKKDLGLREFARRVGISPTYLSQIEADSCTLPIEERVVEMARALDQDPDEFLALAGRVASDVGAIIRAHPREMATFLRQARTLPAQEWERLTREVVERRR